MSHQTSDLSADELSRRGKMKKGLRRQKGAWEIWMKNSWLDRKYNWTRWRVYEEKDIADKNLEKFRREMGRGQWAWKFALVHNLDKEINGR